eukprot:1160045-Pelagomonas_calceolata.AAC.6
MSVGTLQHRAHEVTCPGGFHVRCCVSINMLVWLKGEGCTTCLVAAGCMQRTYTDWISGANLVLGLLKSLNACWLSRHTPSVFRPHIATYVTP